MLPFAATAFLAVFAVPATAATITVNTTADELGADGQCSLREAITAANTNSAPFAGAGECAAGSGADTITLPAGTYALTRTGTFEDGNTTGDLDIRDATTIVGAGAATTTIDAKGIDRVIQVFAGRVVTIEGVTITGGHAPDGQSAGESVGAEGVGAGAGENEKGEPGEAGENGGGILNAGSLTLVQCVVAGNRAGRGGAGGNAYGGFGGPGGGSGGTAFGGFGGAGGNGGGVDDTGGLTLIRSTITKNFSGDGGDGGVGIGGSGGGAGAGNTGQGGAGNGGGNGGGVAEELGQVVIVESTISENHAGSGGEGGEGLGGSGGGGGSGSGKGGSGGGGVGAGGLSGGFGGGVYAGESLTVTDSLIAGNSAGAGAPGGPGFGGNGGPGGKEAGAGGKGGTGSGTFGTSPGYGGAISVLGETTITNTTLTGNSAGNDGAGGEGVGGDGGNGGIGGAGGNGGAGFGGGGFFGGGGGGIINQGTARLLDLTISSNSGGNLGAGGAAQGGAGGSGGGTAGEAHPGVAGKSNGTGGVDEPTRSLEVENTIVAANSPTNCEGTLTDRGHNISFPDTTCPGANVDPLLGPLAENGGPTLTRALLPLSPAIDAVPATGAGCPATDQRGVTRPQGPACDIGAFELAVPAPAPGGGPTGGGPTGGGPTVGGSTGGTGTGTGTGAGAPVATLAALSGLAISPQAFAAAPSGSSALAAVRRFGAKVRFALNEPAGVRFAVLASTAGRRARGGRCLKPTPATRRAHSCTLLVPVRGSFTIAGAAGANSFRFTGRLAGRTLKPGTYQLVATPAAGGSAGHTVEARFRIVR